MPRPDGPHDADRGSDRADCPGRPRTSSPSLVVVSRADGPSGVAFDRRVDGQTLSFEAAGDALVDEQTRSRWTRGGAAADGPLEGARLEALPVRSSFWFAFVASFPETDVFDAEAVG